MTQVCTAHLPPRYSSSIRCPSSALFVYLGLSPASHCLAQQSWTTDPIHKSLVFITYYPNLFSRKRSLTCAYFLLLEGHYATLQDDRQARLRTVRIVPFARVDFFLAFAYFVLVLACFAAPPAKYIYLYLCDTRIIRYYSTSARSYRCTPLHLTYVSCSSPFQCAYKYFIIYPYPCPFISQLPTDTHIFSPVRNFFRQQATPRRSCASPRTNKTD
jgi:hypothetical protein